MERLKRNIIAIPIVLTGVILLLTTCKRDERDNPWDENANPDAWAPKNLAITVDADNSVTLTWEYDGSPTIDGFIIDRKEVEGSWVEGFASISSNQRSFTDNSITVGEIFTYRLYSNLGSSYSSAIENGMDGATSTITYHNYTYQAVYIDGREWFAENLRTTKYRNDNDIPTGLNDDTWGSTTSGAYAIYTHSSIDGLNSNAEVLEAYGALYNWYAVNTGNLCPTGWHVPTDAEWTALTDYVGGASVAGNKLKATSGWNSGGNGTDEYGFSALPGGYRRNYDGTFSNVGNYGYWWSSTEYDATYAWYRYVGYDYGSVGRRKFSKRYGFSVRCVRDND